MILTGRQWSSILDEALELARADARPLKWVNTDDYDIVPKKDFIKRQIAEKEGERRRLEGAKSKSLRYYDEAIEKAYKEIEDLKKQT